MVFIQSVKQKYDPSWVYVTNNCEFCMLCPNNEQCTNSQVQRENTNQEQDKHEPLKKEIIVLKKQQYRNHSSPPIQFYQNFKKIKEIQSAVHELKSAKKTEPIHAHSLRTTQMPPNCHCD